MKLTNQKLSITAALSFSHFGRIQMMLKNLMDTLQQEYNTPGTYDPETSDDDGEFYQIMSQLEQMVFALGRIEQQVKTFGFE